MIWFLVFTVYSGCPAGDSMIINCVKSANEIRIEMPSKEVCQQIAALNKGGYECWARDAAREG